MVNKIFKRFATIMSVVVMLVGIIGNTSYAADTSAVETPSVVVPGNVYNFSFEYYNDKKQWVYANVQMIFASATPTLGSGVAISGIPKDSYNWDSYMPVDLWYYTDYAKYESVEKEYGNDGYGDELIYDGTILYIVDGIIDPSSKGVDICFGAWYSGGDGGYDASLTWNNDGTISAFGNCTMTNMTDGSVFVFNTPW